MTQDLPSLTLLGPLALRIGAERQKLPFAGRTRRLFVFLAGHANCAVRRDTLIDELWTDTIPPRAQSGLNTALWRVKQGLRPFAGFAVQSIDDLVRLDVTEPARIDSDQLEQALAALSGGARLGEVEYVRLLTSVKLCRGPFLDGCSDHWVLPLRERFAALHIRALTLLMRDRAARGDFDSALDHGRAILALDGLREGTQREVIWLYALNGQRAQAILQFKALTRLLREELGIGPMPETIALYEKIARAEDSVLRLAETALKGGRLEPSMVPAVCLNSADQDVKRH